MSENTSGKMYIAEKKVRGLRTLEFTTPLGGEIIEVSFDDGSVREMPKRRFDAVRTFKVSDATKEREAVTELAASQILAVLHECGIKFIEVNNLVDAVVNSVQKAHDDATNILWKVPFHGEQDLNQIKRVLSSNAKRQENHNGAAPAGGGVAA